jgi:hypothetical protein
MVRKESVKKSYSLVIWRCVCKKLSHLHYFLFIDFLPNIDGKWCLWRQALPIREQFWSQSYDFDLQRHRCKNLQRHK